MDSCLAHGSFGSLHTTAQKPPKSILRSNRRTSRNHSQIKLKNLQKTLLDLPEKPPKTIPRSSPKTTLKIVFRNPLFRIYWSFGKIKNNVLVFKFQ